MKSNTLVEKTSKEIIKLINEGNYKSGMKLPNEYELSDQLGVSRNTVREAIKALVSRNILEIRRGSGTFVSKKMGVSDDPLGLSFVKDRHKLALDLMDVRIMIEPQIAMLAAQNAEPEDIKKLETLLNEFEEMILSGENHLEKDIEFHALIAKCSKNLVVSNLIPIINESLIIFFNVFKNMDIETSGKRTIKIHRDIFEAIKNKKPYEAHEVMSFHLLYNKNRLEYLKKA